MKKIKCLLIGQILTVVFLSGLLTSCNKEKEYIDFTDDAFLSALLELGVDTDGNDKISFNEAEAVTSLDLTGFSMENLGGIEEFVNLDTLICYETGITSLDVSGNAELVFLFCSFNSIASLDLSKNTKLTFLYAAGNELTNLDLSQNALLKRLDLNRNKLTELDVTSNPALTELLASRNTLYTLDVSDNNHLIHLDISQNQLTSLDVSTNLLLERLWVSANQLTSLDLSNNSKIVELDIRSMSTLEQVCVWTMPFPPTSVSVYTTESPNVVFTDNCGN